MSVHADTRRARGFTLLELLVVLAIMAAIAAAFPLALNRFVAARRADVATMNLFTSVRAAQMKSVASGKPARIEIVANGYQAQDRLVTLNSRTRLVLRAAEQGDEKKTLVFYPDGSTSGGVFEIVDGNHRRDIVVSMLTGQVRVIATRGAT
jgi:general secretion pathway protein H